MSELTKILAARKAADARTSDRLLPLVYEQLRRLAAHYLAGEKPGQTLQATALVHEAWLRLAGAEPTSWGGRQQFFAAAAKAMRRILVENARRKQCLRHGGHLTRVQVEDARLACPLPDDQLLAVDAALDRLAAVNPRAAKVVELRFFGGFTEAQAAKHLGIATSTVERIWTFARAWLFREIQGDLKPKRGVRENTSDIRI
mgnify:CR=1 FL=1